MNVLHSKTTGVSLLIAASVLGGSVFIGNAAGQAARSRTKQYSYTTGPAVDSNPIGHIVTVQPGFPESAASNKTNEAIKELKAAKSDEAKAAATDTLREALDDEYDASLENYESSIEKMEERLESIRDELVRRRDARDEIVKLRLKTLLNEADGLGWPNARMRQSMPDDPTFKWQRHTELLPGAQPIAPVTPVAPTAPRARRRR